MVWMGRHWSLPDTAGYLTVNSAKSCPFEGTVRHSFALGAG